MQFPLSTGQVARLLDTTEPKIAEEVRRGRMAPAPPVVAGRRLWSRDHVLHVAQCLDLLTDDLRRAFAADGEELGSGSPAREVSDAGR